MRLDAAAAAATANRIKYFFSLFLAIFLFDCLYSIFGFEAARCCLPAAWLLPALAAGNRRTFKRAI